MPGNVSTSDNILSGHLVLRACTGKATTVSRPVRRWFVLHRGFVLYSYKSRWDRKALTATPVPGYTVHFGAEELRQDPVVPDREKDLVVKMFYPHAQSSFVLHTASASPQPIGGGIGTNTLGHSQISACKKIYYLVAACPELAERYLLRRRP